MFKCRIDETLVNLGVSIDNVGRNKVQQRASTKGKKDQSLQRSSTEGECASNRLKKSKMICLLVILPIIVNAMILFVCVP